MKTVSFLHRYVSLRFYVMETEIKVMMTFINVSDCKTWWSGVSFEAARTPDESALWSCTPVQVWTILTAVNQESDSHIRDYHVQGLTDFWSTSFTFCAKSASGVWNTIPEVDISLRIQWSSHGDINSKATSPGLSHLVIREISKGIYSFCVFENSKKAASRMLILVNYYSRFSLDFSRT